MDGLLHTLFPVSSFNHVLSFYEHKNSKKCLNDLSEISQLSKTNLSYLSLIIREIATNTDNLILFEMNYNFFPDSARRRSVGYSDLFPNSQRQRSNSPISHRNEGYSDRFIPTRPSNSLGEVLIKDEMFFEEPPLPTTGSDDQAIQPPDGSPNLYSSLLQMQILAEHNEEINITNNFSNTPSKKNSINILKFKSPKRRKSDFENHFSASPLQQEKFQSPKVKTSRKISKVPYKVLDAPSLVDDYYLNLLDWSSTNLISIGLDNTVYVWSAITNKAFKLHEIPGPDTVCSVAWNNKATHLAVGESNGKLKLFDPESCKVIREMSGHTCRVGSIAWNGNLLSTGSRDRTILTRDIRVPGSSIYKLIGHKQEICGLKWSFDENLLASGGNDNKVLIWNNKTQGEMARFSEHTAAVKALAWSPHQYNILATGGGKSDKTIKFWNMQTLKRVESIDTGSQVCNMMFSVNSNELISTHGYSMNEICIWNYQPMQKIATLTGHTSRVLYLGMSPNGENVVTGAGDETLRFWNVFPSKKSKNDDLFERCVLQPSSIDLR